VAIIRGGAATPTRYYKKKKKLPAVHAPAAPHRPAAPASPKGPGGPGHVKSVAPFIAIAKKSQAGKSLGLKDIQYMQRLAWTTKVKGGDDQLRQAIDIARKWIDGLKAKGGIDVKTKQGEKVNIGAGGLDYHPFHEKNVIQPTKAYQSYLDSYKVKVPSLQPSTPFVDLSTPATPTPQASDLPVPPADDPVRNIALGQWRATGTIPGPQKMVDLLAAGLSMTDVDPASQVLGPLGADAWMQFMQAAHKFPSKVPPPADDAIPVGGTAADLMFKQADFSKAPDPDAGNHPGFWSFGTGGLWNRAKQWYGTTNKADAAFSNPDEYLGKTPEVVSPGARDLDWFMGLDEAQKKAVQKALAERGFTPAKSGPLGTMGSVMPYVSQVNQFVYSSNLAAAMFSKDPGEKGDAADILKRTNVQGGGTELGQLAQSMNGSDDELFLTTVYNASMMARPVGVSESGFALWYSKKWGTENLPQTEQAGAQGVSKGGVFASIFDDLKAPPEVVWHFVATSGKLGDFVTKGMAYDAKAVAKGADWMWSAPETAPVVGPTIKAVHGGVNTAFTKANETVGLAFSEANRIAVAYRINSLLKVDPSYKPGGPGVPMVTKDPSTGKMVGTLDPTGKTFPNQDAVDHINGYASMLETGAKAWKMSEGRGLWYQYLSDTGVDPADHEFLAFWGQMGIDTGFCPILQSGAAAVVGGALKSTPALAALKALQVKSHAEILTASTSASRIKALYNVTDEAATELAGIKNLDEIMVKLNGPDQFGAKYFDPDLHFTARSIAQNLRVKMTGNTKLAPAYRAFMSPLPEGVFDCVVDTDQQVLGALRYAGLDSKTAHEFADGLIQARLGAADFPEMAVRNYLTHPKTGFNALIEKHFRGQSVSKEFFQGASVSAPGAMLKEGGLMSDVASALRAGRAPLKAVPGKGASTKLDELNSFVRRLRGKKAGVEAPATRVGYSLRPGATVVDRLQEGSLALPPELTEPVLVKVRAANKVMEDIDKRLPGADAKTAASLGAKRASAETSKQAAIHELNIMEPQVVGMPTAATEAQFAKTFSPDYTPTELALFSGGKGMQDWAIIQKNLHLTDINSAFKRMWLSRMGTMLTIIGSDEMLRAMLNGVNPLGGIKGLKKLPGFEGTLSADAAEASLRSPSTMVNIHGITDVKRATDWGEIGPDSADITTRNMGVHQSLKTFNAETSMPVKDWLEARDAAYADLVADAERAKLPITVKPPKVGDSGVKLYHGTTTVEAPGGTVVKGKNWTNDYQEAMEYARRKAAKDGSSPVVYTSSFDEVTGRSAAGDISSQSGRVVALNKSDLTPPKVGDVAPGVGRAEVDAQIADLEREASILIEGKPEARAPVNFDQPVTDADLRGYIRAKGGISRDNAFWSKPSGKPGDVSVGENRRMFGYLDTPKGGMPIDELADLIGNDAPGFGIYDSGDLFGWLQKQGAEKATTTATEANTRLAEIEAEIARLQAASPKASVPLSSLDKSEAAPTPILSERDQIALHKAKASAAADAELGRLMREDGSPLNNLLRERNSNAFDPQLLAEGLDNEPWIKSIGDEWNRRIHAMMSHNVTESHLRTGEIGPNDLKSATVQNIYGPVQYAIDRNPVGNALTYLPLKFSDTVLGTLGHMATHLKKQEFGMFFDERMATLKGIDMPRLEKLEVSRKYAVAKTDELSYLSGRTLVEENMRNVVMFLPAYRQFLTWWAKRFATHPFGTHQLMKGLSSVPPVRIPDDTPLIGGVQWNPQSMNFFAGLSGEGNQSWLPPVAPTITVPAMVGALTGNPEANAFYKKLNGGFEPGGPQMRWLDSLVYGAFGATFYDVENRLGIPDPGSKQIDTSRKKRIAAEIVAQAVMTDGKGIDAGAAVAAVRRQELGKGAIQWLLPGTWSAKKAKFTTTLSDGTKMNLDMGRIATAQWQYLSAITPEAKAKVLVDYPEYVAVEKYWSLHGEKALDYLSKNRWVIGLVGQRNESAPTDATPITPPGDPLSPQALAISMQARYNDVDKYVLSKEYQAQKKIWDKGFAEKYKNRKGQAKDAVKDPKQAFQDWYYKPRQAKFYADHKAEMDRLLMDNNKPVGLKEHTTVLKRAGEQHLFANPYVFPDMLGRTKEQQLSAGDYEGMKRLEGSGLLWGKELVQGSRRYDQYVGMRKEEIAGIQRRFLTAALAPYKSGVHPDDWALFGKGWNEKTAPALGNKLLGFLGEIEKRSAALRKLTFATKEYKAEYYKLQDYIHTVKTKNKLLAPYIGASAPKLLGTGQLALDKPAFVNAKPETMAEWKKLRITLYSTPGVVTAKTILKLKQKASPELQANWDESTKALGWDFTFRLAAQGRDALTKSNNPYGWYKGWTIESKYGTTMQNWMKQNMHAWINPKAPISKSFFRQWGEADKAAGGNIIYDLLDTSK